MPRPIALVLSVCVASAAAAQSPSATLAPVVITATRVETAVRAPASVTVLHGDSLRTRGITHLAEALRLVPGLTVVAASSYGSQTSLFVRGGQGNYTRVLLDGVPLNEPGGALDLSTVTLDNIERVEVVRGPASVLYGEDAVTGVIQLVSRTSASQSRGAIALERGSYGARDIALSASATRAFLTASAAASDRAVQGSLPFNNAYHNRAASLSLRLRPGTHTDATVSARWQAATYHYPTESDGRIADRNAENTSHRLALAFSGRRTLGERLAASWTLTSSEHDPRSNDAPDTPGDTLGFFGFFSRGTVTRRAADLRLTARAGSSQSLTVGAEWMRDHERSRTRSLSEYGEESGDFTAARSGRAVYLQALGTVRTRGSYQVGGRLDDNSAFGTFRTLRAGAAWQLPAGYSVRAAAGTAFRAPSFFENFATGYVRGNAALAPERTRGHEAALEYRSARVSASITAYQQRFRDLIQYTSRPSGPAAPNYLNVAAANADGVEFDASSALPAGLRARTTYTYIRTRVTDAGMETGAGAAFVLGEPMVRRPAHVARLEVGRSIATRGTLTVGAAYTGRAHDRNYSSWPAAPVMLRPHTLVDVAATLPLSSPNARWPLQARARADNLTNVDYQGVFGFRAPGRMLRIGLTLGEP